MHLDFYKLLASVCAPFFVSAENTPWDRGNTTFIVWSAFTSILESQEIPYKDVDVFKSPPKKNFIFDEDMKKKIRKYVNVDLDPLLKKLEKSKHQLLQP